MNVCTVGGGGREHALAAACAREGADVVVTPGNADIPWSTPVPPENLEADLFVIGPERPLVDGLADRLRAQSGQAHLCPRSRRRPPRGLEGVMKEIAGVDTARYATFTDPAKAKKALGTMGDLLVIKTDGLADGKGVLVTSDRAEAEDAVDRYLDGSAFGDAGRRLVIEEGLTGPELSVLAICDGKTAVPLPAARDYKRLGDGDTSPNTGGMGTYSPVPDAPKGIEDYVIDKMVEPTLAALRRRGIDYRGVLYAGVMLTPDGPKLLEYNVRFGDPEAQAVLPRIERGLVDTMRGAAQGRMESCPIIGADSVVCVVVAAPGYPAAPQMGVPVTGIETAGPCPARACSRRASNTHRTTRVSSPPAGAWSTSAGRVRRSMLRERRPTPPSRRSRSPTAATEPTSAHRARQGDEQVAHRPDAGATSRCQRHPGQPCEPRRWPASSAALPTASRCRTARPSPGT
jgi:phosphoribosylamine--glycine ligase